MNIIEVINDERFFKPLFKDLETWHSWMIFLKALFGLPIESRKDRRLFKRCTGLKSAPKRASREAYVIAGRRSGKSFISAIIAVFLSCFKDWSEYLSPGEKGHIFIIANDRPQAKIIKDYISGIMHAQPVFKNLIEDDLQWEVRLKNQVIISVKTSDFRTVRGYTILAAICEEVAFWRDLETSANPTKEIITALKPSLAAVPGSLLLGISTAYSMSGFLYEQHKQFFGQSGEVLIWQAPTLTMNPTISKETVQDALREDKSSAQAEWLGKFRTCLEAFLPQPLTEAAVVPGRIELPKIEGIRYFAFADSASGGTGGDSFTLAISHRDSNSGKIILDLIREARPPFRPSDIIREFSGVLKSYGIYQVVCDKYAIGFVQDEFQKNSIMFEASELTTSEIYLSFLPLISNRSIEFLDNKRLVNQATSLERRTRSGGRDIIDHYPGGHDDLINAACGACVLAASQTAIVRGALFTLGITEKVKTGIEKYKARFNEEILTGKEGDKAEELAEEEFEREWDIGQWGATEILHALESEEEQEKTFKKFFKKEG